MSELTAPRDSKEYGESVKPPYLAFPMAASKSIQPGALVALTALGYGISAGDATAKIVAGVYRGSFAVDNSSGAAGALTVNPVRQGVFKFDNSTAGDAIALANTGGPCFVVNDHQVALTDNNGARILAGTVVLVESDGVWVEVGLTAQPGGGLAGALVVKPISWVSFAVDLVDIADGVIWTLTPHFAGRIVKFKAVVAKAATTAAKLSTLTPYINGVSVTGGALALTSANMTPIGNEVSSSAITALNSFASGTGGVLTVVASSTTAFVEGAVNIYLGLG